MTELASLEDGIAALLAEPASQLLHCQLIDRLTDEGADVRAELVKLVCAHKASDGPRLAFAEWCERNGEGVRAEFVRVQCEWALLGNDVWGLRHPVPVSLNEERIQRINWLGTCQDEILAAYGLGWQRGGIFPFFAVTSSNYASTSHRGPERRLIAIAWHPGGDAAHAIFAEYSRGFLSRVRCDAADWLAHAQTILAAHPVDRVTLRTIPELKYDFQGGDTPRFAHLPGRADKKLMFLTRGTHQVKCCLEAVYPGITFEFPR